jgi:hypothetical protein
MWMIQYINKIKKQLVDQYGCAEDPNCPGVPKYPVPDGEYPMEIEGKIDNVLIENNKIFCCRFNKDKI